MTTREAVYDDVGNANWTFANCYSCGCQLGSAPHVLQEMRMTYLSLGLVARSTHRETGLPRYGPPRRLGHGDASRHTDSHLIDGRITRGLGGLTVYVDFYVNCPTCDRGQIVRANKMHVAPSP